jgi:hypothetical protein
MNDHDVVYGAWLDRLERDPVLRHLSPEMKQNALRAMLAAFSDPDQVLDDVEEVS